MYNNTLTLHIPHAKLQAAINQRIGALEIELGEAKRQQDLLKQAGERHVFRADLALERKISGLKLVVDSLTYESQQFQRPEIALTLADLAMLDLLEFVR